MIIPGVSVCSLGEARGHNLKVDETLLSQLASEIQRKIRVPVKLNHRGGLDTGTLVEMAKEDPTLIARGIGGALMAMIIVMVAWMIWWPVGTWRAATAYTGFAGWAALAKIMLVIQVWAGLLAIWRVVGK